MDIFCYSWTGCTHTSINIILHCLATDDLFSISQVPFHKHNVASFSSLYRWVLRHVQKLALFSHSKCSNLYGKDTKLNQALCSRSKKLHTHTDYSQELSYWENRLPSGCSPDTLMLTVNHYLSSNQGSLIYYSTYHRPRQLWINSYQL